MHNNFELKIKQIFLGVLYAYLLYIPAVFFYYSFPEAETVFYSIGNILFFSAATFLFFPLIGFLFSFQSITAFLFFISFLFFILVLNKYYRRCRLEYKIGMIIILWEYYTLFYIAPSA